MNKQDWNAMSESDLDALLTASVSEPPPDDVIRAVTPWRRAMNRVLTGMALSTITLNFWALNYILPAVGVLLSLLGFRALRRENGWFRGCWILTLVRTVSDLFTMCLLATIFHSAVQDFPAFRVWNAIHLLAIFLQLFFLWRGFHAVQRKAGLPAHAGGAAALPVWYAVVGALALLEYSGLLLLLPMLAAYALILRSLVQLSRELDEAGYAVEAAPVRLSDRAVRRVFLVLAALGLLSGFLFGGRYPMDWQPADASTSAEAARVKAHLAGLGFPEDVLADLTDEEILACDGALRVRVTTDDHAVNDGRQVATTSGNSTHVRTVYDVRELRITSVGVELPGARERWRIFHHFRWVADPGCRGTEAIQLWPAYQQPNEGWAADGGVTGRVLYDADGMTYAAPYYSLDSVTYTADSILWGEQTSTDVFAAFSLPRRGENCRGYLAYSIEELQDSWIINAWINYTHQTSRVQYPVQTAMEHRMTGGWNHTGPFRTVQDALQFYPFEDDAAPF